MRGQRQCIVEMWELRVKNIEKFGALTEKEKDAHFVSMF